VLATTSLARAEDSCRTDGARCARVSAFSAMIAGPLHARKLGRSDSPLPTHFHPYQGLHAAAYPLSRIGLFALSEEFALSGRTLLFDFEGGAIFRLDDDIDLTASYRVLSVDLAHDSDVNDPHVERRIAAPFLALVFGF
jgi:hypothetical protein